MTSMKKEKHTKSVSTTATNKIPTIVAIDPGTKHLGFAHFTEGHLVDCGVRTIAQGELLKEVFSNIDAIVARLLEEKTPDVLVLESNGLPPD
jgi:RNase H-fold protein (predicted Holliday junction resolvase)